jgi:hypothetical protein
MKQVATAVVTPDTAGGIGQVEDEFGEQSSSIHSLEPGVMKPAKVNDTDRLMDKVANSTGQGTNDESLAGAKEIESKVKSKLKVSNVFKKNVFRIVEKNELETYNSAGQLRGYADIESVDGAFRYKIGVIDFLTKYSKLKFIEN